MSTETAGTPPAGDGNSANGGSAPSSSDAEHSVPVAGASSGLAGEEGSVATTAAAPPAPDASGGRLNLRAAVEAGLAAGVVGLLLQPLLASLAGPDTLGPVEATLQAVLGATPGEMSAGALSVAILLHLGVSVALTTILARVVHRWRTYVAAAIGLAFGGVIYTGNVVLLAFVRPETALWGSINVLWPYAAFGVIAAVVYKERSG